MTGTKKLASAAIKNRSQTPFWSWVRDRLLAVNRTKDTPPPGLPTADGNCHYHYPHRFPNTQSSRSPDPPAIPGGVHHLLSDNYYQSRDARRNVEPPPRLYQANVDGEIGQFYDTEKKSIESAFVAASKGPKENYGLKAPTPGFGYEWTRITENERPSQIHDENLAAVTKFDKYTKLQ